MSEMKIAELIADLAVGMSYKTLPATARLTGIVAGLGCALDSLWSSTKSNP